MTPEAEARLKIDERLIQAGWVIQNVKQLNLSAGFGVAVREFPTDTGPVDYALFVDGVPVGVIEAKPDDAAEDVTLKRNLILSLVYRVRCLEHGTFAVDLILDGSGKKKIDITPDEVMSNGGDWWSRWESNPRPIRCERIALAN